VSLASKAERTLDAVENAANLEVLLILLVAANVGP
jgi:hypothetical protein